MSPLLDLQRRLVEIGRIRLGEQVSGGSGRTRPAKRETWRLTSRDKARLEAAQRTYDGELRPWGEQWELLTEATELAVMLIPGQELSQWYEMWGSPASGGAVSCLRRCDGVREILSDGPCLCPENGEERNALAAKGKACKPTTRLSVLLPAVEGIGCWRMETHGYYAAVELAGAAEILRRATEQGILLPARLRLDQREARRAGQVRRFPVPVIEVDVTPTEMLAIAGGGAEGPALSSSPAALPPAREPSSQKATPISDAQRRLLFREAKQAGVSEERLREIIGERYGESSTGAIPADDLDGLLVAVRAA